MFYLDFVSSVLWFHMEPHYIFVVHSREADVTDGRCVFWRRLTDANPSLEGERRLWCVVHNFGVAPVLRPQKAVAKPAQIVPFAPDLRLSYYAEELL